MKIYKGKSFIKILLMLFVVFSSFICNAHNQRPPAAHILMPAYNVNNFILSTIETVLNQDYSNVKLFIFNDGSTDDTLKKITNLLKNNHNLTNKIYIQSSNNNVGVAKTRTKLIKWSKNADPNAYIFWLDADDKYTSKSYISEVIQKTQATKADICLVNFSIIYEDDAQKKNASGLIKEKENMAKIINSILASPKQSINP